MPSRVQSRVLGRRGEHIATRTLRKLGFIILERNWKSRYAEIDIIAMHGRALHCIEVKFRTTEPGESASNFVSSKQLQRIGRGMAYYRRLEGPRLRRLRLRSAQVDLFSVFASREGKIIGWSLEENVGK